MRTSLPDSRCSADFALFGRFRPCRPRLPFGHRLSLRRARPAVWHLSIENALAETRAGVVPLHRGLGVEIEFRRPKAGARRAGRL
ncbi:hypothetical protein ACH4GP_30120 [Streptomyces celluloflavus]|uniref:Uncharacterized protein n=1 Tax=Streptomyces celluloflavus TaxID=58344 RepID=A0ABW7RLD9_9ACTN